jgi:DNA-binding HxlR family transcriptional regulator
VNDEQVWREDYDETMDAVSAILAVSRKALEGSENGRKLCALISHTARDGIRRGGPRADPIYEVYSLIGDKWSSLVFVLLGTGPFRHTVLRRLVGAIGADKNISQPVLTATLRSLERDGLVQRTTLATVPRGVEYSLTPMGQELLVELQRLTDWVHRRGDDIRAAQAAFKRNCPEAQEK